MSESFVVASCVWIPLLGAALIALTGSRPNLRETVTLVTAGVLFLQVLTLLPTVEEGWRPTVLLVEVIPAVPILLEVEPLGMLFGLVASFLWIVTSIYSIGYMRGHDEPHQTRFYVCFAIALSSALGVAFAGNLFTLFIFYEVLTLSTYPLVTHSGTEEARRAGRLYLQILLGTSIGLQLLAIVWTWALAGTTAFVPGGILAGRAIPEVVGLLYALFVFGIGKAAVMPFHRWLPAAMVAPTPVSALLHAVAVVKAGVFSILKITVYTFGIDLLARLGVTDWLLWVAAATILIGSVVAMTKDNLKARLAYSTVSQLSYIVLGAMLANGWAVIGAAMHIAMHAFAKITLFFCAGAVMVATHKTEVSEMRGLGRRMPITMAAFAVGSLSIIGLPLLGGMWSKWFLALGTLEAGALGLLAVLMLSALLNIVYLLPIPIRAFASPPDEAAGDGHGEGHDHDGHGHGHGGGGEAPLPCLIALGLTALGCLVLFWSAERLYALLAPIVAPATGS